MNSVNKAGITRNLLWGAFAVARTLYGIVTWQRDSKRAVEVDEVATEVATDAIARQAEPSQPPISLAPRVTPLPEASPLVPLNLYPDFEDVQVPKKPSHASWGWPLGLGAAGAVIPLLSSSAANAEASAESASSGFSAFGYLWNALPTAVRIGVAAVSLIGIFYTAHKIHQAWKRHWGNTNLTAPVNNNTNTNTLTNTMHIHLQLTPGMKLVKTVNQNGQEEITVQIEDRQAQKRAAAAAA